MRDTLPQTGQNKATDYTRMMAGHFVPGLCTEYETACKILAFRRLAVVVLSGIKIHFFQRITSLPYTPDKQITNYLRERSSILDLGPHSSRTKAPWYSYIFVDGRCPDAYGR
jgi:hypothetical protein